MAFPLAVAAAVVVGALGTTVVAGIAHAAGVSHSFSPLHPGTYIALIVLGVLGGAVGWQLIRARARQPAKLLRTLVPAVVILSCIPDIAIGIAGGFHATWGGVIALMAAHVVVATTAVASFATLLPVEDPSADRGQRENPNPGPVREAQVAGGRGSALGSPVDLGPYPSDGSPI
jgi:hypothetical protein